MAETFVKLFKRDYARVSAKPNAASVLRQLDSWFGHYNNVHPVHPNSALGYLSPREFRKRMMEKTTGMRSALCVDRMNARCSPP
jgi:putative transposase